MMVPRLPANTRPCGGNLDASALLWWKGNAARMPEVRGAHALGEARTESALHARTRGAAHRMAHVDVVAQRAQMAERCVVVVGRKQEAVDAVRDELRESHVVRAHARQSRRHRFGDDA